jgi:hypothetical protein
VKVYSSDGDDPRGVFNMYDSLQGPQGCGAARECIQGRDVSNQPGVNVARQCPVEPEDQVCSVLQLHTRHRYACQAGPMHVRDSARFAHVYSPSCAADQPTSALHVAAQTYTVPQELQ